LVALDMKSTKSLRVGLALLSVATLLSLLACKEEESPPTLDKRAIGASTFRRPDVTEVMSKMPANDEKQCVAISLITEALLEAEINRSIREGSARQVARDIYRNATKESHLKVPARIMVDGKQASVFDTAGLHALRTAVDEYYKAEYGRNLDSTDRKLRIIEAQDNCLKSIAEVEGMISDDADGIICLIGIGERQFPDGTVKESYHAFLLQTDESGGYIVHDPNASERPYRCSVDDTGEYVNLQWCCPYRTTGAVTCQKYRMTLAPIYFRAFFGSE
jgi:hypothetical protein